MSSGNSSKSRKPSKPISQYKKNLGDWAYWFLTKPTSVPSPLLKMDELISFFRVLVMMFPEVIRAIINREHFKSPFDQCKIISLFMEDMQRTSNHRDAAILKQFKNGPTEEGDGIADKLSALETVMFIPFLLKLNIGDLMQFNFLKEALLEYHNTKSQSETIVWGRNVWSDRRKYTTIGGRDNPDGGDVNFPEYGIVNKKFDNIKVAMLFVKLIDGQCILYDLGLE